MRLLFAFAGLVFVSCALGNDECLSWNSSISATCSNTISDGSLFFLANGTTVQQVNDSISGQLDEITSGNISSPCSIFFVELVCNEAFPPCLNNTATGRVFPQPVCRSVCTSISRECNLTNTGLSAPDCTSVQSGTPRFPMEGEPRIINDGGVLFEVPCVTPEYSALDLSCPDHFSPVADYDPKEGGIACDRTCPYETWSEGEYLGLYIPTGVLGAIGIILCSCFVCPTFCDKRHFRFPRIMPTMVLLLAICTCFFLMWPIFFSYQDVMCANDTTFSDNDNTECAIYAIGVYWLSLSTVLWWLTLLLVISLTSLRLVNFTKRKKTILHWSCHVFVWGFSTVATIYVATNGRFVGIPESGIPCFVDPDVDDGWWLAGTFIIPVGCIVVLGIALLSVYPVAVILGCIPKVKRANKDVAKYAVKWTMRSWRIHVFLVYYGVVWVQLLVYYIIARCIYDITQEGKDDWYHCLEQGESNCDLDDQIPFGVTAYIHYVAVTSPLVIIVLFGFTLSNLRFYGNWIWGLLRFRICVLSGSGRAIKKKRIQVHTRKKLQEAQKKEKQEKKREERKREKQLPRFQRAKKRAERQRKALVNMTLRELRYGFGANTREPKELLFGDQEENTDDEPLLADQNNAPEATTTHSGEAIEMEEIVLEDKDKNETTSGESSEESSTRMDVGAGWGPSRRTGAALMPTSDSSE